MNMRPHRRASDDYQNRVDARLVELGLSHFTSTESPVVDDRSCSDLLAEHCAEYIAEQRSNSAATS
jgi:hypothetical protein